MSVTKRLLLAAALLALGAWLWTVLFPGPERIIRKILAEVAGSASFAPNEGPLARLANVNKLAGHFSLDVEIALDAADRGRQTLSGRDELMQAAMAARNAFQALRVELLDPNIELAPDRQSAVVDLTAKATVPGRSDFMVQEMKFTLKRMDGHWLITRVETVRTLT